MDKVKIVISDCHLSAGRFFEGKLNPHEDFHFDDEMCDFFEYFSTGKYGEGPDGPIEVELFINGDYLDFLNVPHNGEFEDHITEADSLRKLEAIIDGHPKVMKALKRFASQPNKKITYLIGNHDADLFFPKIRERITQEWDPEGKYPSDRVEVIADRDRVRLFEGIEVRHGNQFEAVHVLDFENPILDPGSPQPVLGLPWGSFYVLKIVNRLKTEREFIDKVRPVKIFVFFGLMFDTLFTLKFMFLSFFYFFKTRFIYSPKRYASLRVTAKIIGQETDFMLDLERQARKLLDHEAEVNTIIFGHTHKPMDKLYPDGKQYINTGTWTKMINLDLRNIGQQYCLSFAYIQIRDGKAEAELRQWSGEHGPHQGFRG